jgi:class 3 adenylate cyclase
VELTMSTRPGVQGFLFADLRGYTRFVEVHGDTAAAELLTEYRDLVRGIVGRHDGAEIRTEGDGVYVVFESVTEALDAGLQLVAAGAVATTANPIRPIRVAVGIHAGETTGWEEGPVGSAVNIAARVCAKAEAGEVLVTETVRSLVRTARPYRAIALGSQRLKGVSEAIPLYRMEAAPSPTATRLRRQIRARRRTLTLVAFALAAVLVAVGAVWAVNRPRDCLTLPADTKDVVVRIDPARACVTQVVAVGPRPGPVIAAAGALWVGSLDRWTVAHVDPAKGVADDWYGVPGSPIALAANATGTIAVLAYDNRTGGQTGSHSVRFIEAPTGTLLEGRGLPGDSDGIASGKQPGAFNTSAYTSIASAGDWFWVLSPRGKLVRVRSQGMVPVDLAGVVVARPSVLAASGGSVWMVDEAAPTVYRWDGLAPKPTVVSLGGSGGSVAAVATPEALWLIRTTGGLTRVDLGSGVQQDMPVDGSPIGLVVESPNLWLLDPEGRVVRSVDEATGHTLATVAVGGHPEGAALLDGALWVSVGGA